MGIPRSSVDSSVLRITLPVRCAAAKHAPRGTVPSLSSGYSPPQRSEHHRQHRFETWIMRAAIERERNLGGVGARLA